MKSRFTKAMKRRHFLNAFTGLVVASLLFGCGTMTNAQKSEIPVALQLYSVRHDCEKDFPGTIAKVAEMGYQGVEFAGFHDYSAEEVRKMLDDNGLKCAGAHVDLSLMLDDALEQTIEFHKIIGNKYLIVPWLNEERRNSKEAWLETAKLFNELAEKVKPHGMMIGYHNHTFEFELIDEEMPWDIFAQNTTDDVILQLDTGNMAGADAEAVPYLKRYPGRSVTIHLKEHSVTKPDALIGQGDIPFKKIFEVCTKTGGTEWYIIEEEKEGLPPIEAVKISYDNLIKLL